MAGAGADDEGSRGTEAGANTVDADGAASSPPGDCFGVPRAAGELCQAVVLTDELDQPWQVAARDGVSYVATQAGLVRVSGSEVERLVECDSFGMWGVALEGNWLVWRTHDELWRASLDGVGTAHRIATDVTEPPATRGGQVFFGTGYDRTVGTALFRAHLDDPSQRDVVTTNASVDPIATDDDHLFYVAPGFGNTELRRVPISGGDGERLATIEGTSSEMTLTTDFVFLSTGRTLYAVRKSGGTAARKVFERFDAGEGVTALTSDSDGVYFVTSTKDANRVYRASLDGKAVRLLGQWYSEKSLASIAADGATLFIASFDGTLRKIPKN
jgi:hypothetical protein